MAVVVDAIYRMLTRGARTHIGKKRIEGGEPLVADVNAASAIVMEIFMRRVIAPLSHPKPCLVFAAPVARGSVFRIASPQSANELTMQAPTALGVSVAQITSAHEDVRPAVATARPKHASIGWMRHTGCRDQSAESFPGEIARFHMSNFTTGVSIGSL